MPKKDTELPETVASLFDHLQIVLEAEGLDEDAAAELVDGFETEAAEALETIE